MKSLVYPKDLEQTLCSFGPFTSADPPENLSFAPFFLICLLALFYFILLYFNLYCWRKDNVILAGKQVSIDQLSGVYLLCYLLTVTDKSKDSQV